MKIHVHELSVGGAGTGEGTGQRVLLRNFSFNCPKGKVMTLMGPSGCGKSSLLAAIAGLRLNGLHANIEVSLQGQNVDQLPTSQRRIGLLFQDDLLFAHMSVRENLLFAVPPGTASERGAQADAALRELGFQDMADRSPLTLSGGQRARVSLMRTLLAQPHALLLDEPFSKLDIALREQFRHFVFDHVRRLQLPTLLVTHDAADIADRDAVINFASCA
ncbi:MAG TPA: ATP-binding cassette domain-containing protein [Burkholderiaceae bacterium]|mgnify:CR=1 FL=1|nr:ATP-binding cassette domain-containing protein [Burkholderiaceae bacterium]